MLRLGLVLLVTLVGCRDKTVPPPNGETPPGGWNLSRRAADIVRPVAPGAPADKGDDPADRLVVVVDEHGKAHWKGKPAAPAELSQALVLQAKAYEAKKRGDDAFVTRGGRRWSELFVLLDVDRDAPWGAVVRLLRLLHDHGFFKVQLGARPRAGSDRLSKLPVPLPTAADPGPATPVRLQVVAGRVVCDVAGRRVSDLARVAENLPPGPLEIDAPESIAVKHVVAVVDRLRVAGADDIRFADVG